MQKRTSGSALTRGGPLVAVIGVHAVIIYFLAVSMGVIETPKFVQPIEAVFIPEPTQPEPEMPKVKPDIEIAELQPQEQPPPEIQFDEVIVPPAETPMPASNNAPAATEATVGQTAQELKTSTRIEPQYPPASRRANEEGTVLLKVLVDASGRPKDVQIGRSSGFSRLDEAAKQAVRRWKFVPATNGTSAISVWTQVSITFRLTDTR